MAGQLHKRLYKDKINVQRISASTVDERGIESQTWQSHLTGVACKIVSSGTSEDKSGRNTILENFSIHVHGDVDIKANDRLQDYDDNDKYYEIDAVRKSHNRSGGVVGVVLSAHYFE
jgi:head-tail adaptor